MFTKRAFLFLLCTGLISTLSLQAQENSGLAQSNYIPTNSVFLNPSSIVDSKAYLDVNVLSASTYLYSGPLYLNGNDFKITQIFGGGNMNVPEPTYQSGKRENNAYSDVMLQGPSFTLSLGRNSIGLYTGARFYTDVRDVPHQIVNFALYGLDYGPQLGQRYAYENFQGHALAYGEVGLSFGRMVHRSDQNIFNVGGTVKYLRGLAHAGLRLQELDFESNTNGSQLDLHRIKGSYAFTEFGETTGSGYGFDLGFTYKRTIDPVKDYIPHSASHDCVYADYRFKAGISVLDIGAVNFKNATMRTITGDNISVNTDTLNSGDLESLDDGLYDELEANGATVAPRSKYSVSLPTALSLQFDYNFGKNIFLGAHYVKGFVRENSYGIERASLLSVVPRYETRTFEVSLPVTFQHFEQFAMGLAFRVGPLVLGTDRLGPWLFRPDVNGMDLYAGLKLPLYKRPACRNGYSRLKQRKKRPRFNNAKPCPSFN